MNPFAGGTATVRASIKVGLIGLPLRPDVEPKLVRTVVDTHLHLPDMFELTFLDEEGNVADDAGLSIGTAVEVYGGAPDSMSATKLIDGEVTSIEAICADLHIYTVIRGYEQAHRLQRARRTRTFVDMTDSDIAVAGSPRTPGCPSAPSTPPPPPTTIWPRSPRPTGTSSSSGPARSATRPAWSTASSSSSGRPGCRRPVGWVRWPPPWALLGLGGPTLTFKDNLLTFLPRVTGANLTSEVEVRVWDPDEAKAVTATAAVRSGTATLSQEPAELADSFGLANPLGIALPAIPGLPDLGTPPSAKAYAVVDRPLASGTSASRAAEDDGQRGRRTHREHVRRGGGVRVGDPDDPGRGAGDHRATCRPRSPASGRSATPGTSSTSPRAATTPGSWSAAARTVPCSGSRRWAARRASATRIPGWSAGS